MSSSDAYAGLPGDYVPRIHRAEVRAVLHISAGIIRVLFGGEDMEDYPTTGIGDEYVRVFFPHDFDQPVPMPFVKGRGWDYPEGVEPGPMRTYTIRKHREGEVEIDFVIHERGIAADWVRQARPGQVVALNPPVPLYCRPAWARRQLLLADEPALPAALRIAELTVHEVETVLIAEVPGVDRQLHVEDCDDSGLTYMWLHGSGNGRCPSSLINALRSTDIDEYTYIWVAGESRVAREARKYLRHERKIPAEGYKCVGYWTNRCEEWTERYNRLDKDVRAQLDALYETEGDAEEIADQINNLLEKAGL